jgi:hypothetical protein
MQYPTDEIIPVISLPIPVLVWAKVIHGGGLFYELCCQAALHLAMLRAVSTRCTSGSGIATRVEVPT